MGGIEQPFVMAYVFVFGAAVAADGTANRATMSITNSTFFMILPFIILWLETSQSMYFVPDRYTPSAEA